MEDIIRVSDLTFRYSGEERDAVYKVNLNIKAGELVAILGHNGSGKSTLAKHFNGVLLPAGGHCYVDGIDTADEERLYDIRQRAGMVFQNPDNQIVATIVEEDVAFGLENLGVEPAEIRRRVDEALESVGMGKFAMHAPHQLSGGQKQRIAIAGVVAMRPKVIILDEPTAMLDPKGRREVLKTIKELNKNHGVTVVLITHFMDEATQCDRVVAMDNGSVILDDTPAKVFAQAALLKEVGLDVPQSTELCLELRKAGFALPDDITTEDQCIEVVSQLLQSKGVN